MSQAKLEQLCKASVLLDSTDLPGLVELETGMRELSDIMKNDGEAEISQTLSDAAIVIQKIVLREAGDLEDSLRHVREELEGLCRLMSGETVIGDNAGRLDESLLAAWLEDCKYVLDEVEAQAGELRSNKDGDATLAEIRRRIHTLKGECGVIPLPFAQKVLHELESEIDICAGGVSEATVDQIFEVIDWMRRYTAALRDNPQVEPPAWNAKGAKPEAAAPKVTVSPSTSTAQSQTGPSSQQSDARSDCATPAQPAPASHAAEGAGGNDPVTFGPDAELGSGAAEFLTEAREHLERSEKAILDLEQRPEDIELINTVFRAFHTIKGVAGFMKLGPIVTLAHSGECLLDGARSSRLKLDGSSLGLILKGCDLLGQLLNAMEGKAAPTQSRFHLIADALEKASRGEAVDYSALGVAATEAATTAETAANAGAVASAAGNAETANKGGSAAVRSDQTVKVSTLRMDALVDMVGELVIANQMVVQDPMIRGITSQQLQRNLATVGKIVRDLQTVSMSLRMVPIKATFQKMTRLVRDLSAKSGKRITLHTEGDDVELDRNMVEVIADPLVHMVRNSCDHGLETPEQRTAAGKGPAGNLWLRAYHSGGAIVIEIEDDGRGLSRDKIVAKAVERGIYEPDRPIAEIPDAEVFNLIFLPGFSTAEKVTDISGRGVGMDVVRRNIEGLRGKIDIRSTAGKGTTFAMRLPLTLAIIDGLVVRVGEQRYVIPTLSVEQSFRPAAKDIHTLANRLEMVMVRGELLPVHRLDKLLNVPGCSNQGQERLLVLVEAHGNRACLAVDAILGQQQVVIKSLGRGIGARAGVAGGAVLGDGRVALILDVAGVLSEAAPAADEIVEAV